MTYSNELSGLLASMGLEMTPEAKARLEKVESNFSKERATNERVYRCSAKCGERVLGRGDICWDCAMKVRGE
jgi:hypothetical protein